MEIATVSRLKASLSAYLRQVKAGEEVVITERGRPIARLLPIAGPSSFTEHLDEMERKGLLRRPTAALPADFRDWPRPVDPGGTVRAAVSRERDEGW
ncbi:MAG: type II toxin-antitoxin system prevent-host-death family antitoxin [Deltaproteobacteria bacterium]|nr:type II toxin-antitoxin system prevent-host-death family antitoxin [Deltaproteobacteria bacterium]